MHQPQAMAVFDHIEKMAGRDQIVTLKIDIVITADLRLQHDYGRRLRKVSLPLAALCQIGVLGGNLRMQRSDHRKISAMLVQHHDVAVTACLQPDD